MTKKRFTETERNCYYTSLVFDNYTQEELGTNKVVVLLNELNDERMMYKTTIDKRIVELEEENEQLQKQVKSFETTMNATSDYNAFLESKITTLEKENEQLRKENKDLNDIEWEKFKKKYHLE